jgi:uncharacterized membrane protein ArfC
MAQANWCLLGVAFALGLVLTLALTIRRVNREVPVSSSVGAAAQSESPTATLTTGATAAAAPTESPSETGTTETEAVDDSPYGAGSARPRSDGSGPKGWLVKGNEDSMLYHTPDSPHYKQTIAEVWFQDTESAEEGGFTAWYRGRADK